MMKRWGVQNGFVGNFVKGFLFFWGGFVLAINPLLLQAKRLDAEPDYAWIQLSSIQSGHPLEVRALVAGEKCPTIRVDGENYSMRRRYDQNHLFPLRVCYWPIHQDCVGVSLGRFHWTLHDVRRVIVLPSLQHFSSQETARVRSAVLSENPDLVVFLGDYMSVRPKEKRWQRWKERFFDRWQALLMKVPVVFVKGRRESRSSIVGDGWHTFFAQASSSQKDDTWLARWSHFYAVILDSSFVKRSLKNSRVLRDHVDRLNAATLNPHPWIISPDPIFCLKQALPSETKQDCQVLRQGLESWLIRHSSLILSGNRSYSMITQFDGLPLQCVIEEKASTVGSWMPVPSHGLSIHQLYMGSGISFVELDYRDAVFKNSRWSLSWVDSSLHQTERCQISIRDVSCSGHFYSQGQ